ncbi:DeoR/GlpR family DNA-binding transcription regulator [Chelativorans sp. M5D2P16]|uniref:DeoR/GlpR family DNA-binding transcription regulator n=1 Tax=Chelativorans sp. M5D2P16 TaxID=3095678 RepID=UPI002ACA4CDF|nr:DeoR/GlpR family DNA-binding transcription regulator [Chelativorans sp. M5D2P16]MDZ5698670.1 DeoR/GlpR family DNA-binding transcription regulator [Chelativorans sp. M5D2P16]
MSGQAKRVELLPAKRRALVLERLRRDGAASLQELSREIKASISTIRRDLEHLTAEGYLVRTYGGAVLVSDPLSTFEREPAKNVQFRHQQKAAIGKVAAERIEPGESVILDGSSTVHACARELSTRGIPLTAVTNSLDIAQLCASCPDWRVYTLGGLVRPGWQMMYGEVAETFLKTIHADICIVGAYAVWEKALTDPSPEIASLKRVMIKAARRIILVIDSSKFRAPAFSEFATVEQIDEIITDDGIAPENLQTLRALNVKVTVVNVPDSEEG